MKNFILNTTWGAILVNFVVLPCFFLIFAELVAQYLWTGLSSDSAVEISILVGMFSVLFFSLIGVIVNGYSVALTLRKQKEREGVAPKLKFSINVLGLILYLLVLFYIVITILL